MEDPYFKGAYAVPPDLNLISYLADHLKKTAVKPIIFLPTNRARRMLLYELKQREVENIPKIICLSNLGEYSRTNLEAASSTELFFIVRHIIEKQKLFDTFQGDVKKLIQGFLSFLNELFIENADFRLFETIELQHFHFPVALNELKTLYNSLKEYLNARELFHPQEVQHRCALKIKETWETSPPSCPIWILGSTGTVYSTKLLMKAVLSSPKGAVFFPASTASLENEPIPSPQYTIHQTASWLGVHLKPLPCFRYDEPFFKNLASLTPNISEIKKSSWPPNFFLKECRCIEHEIEEVEFLTLEALKSNTPVTIVSSSRTFSDQLYSRLSRHNLTIDYSAGLPFKKTLLYNFIHTLRQYIKKPSWENLASLLRFSLDLALQSQTEDIDTTFCRQHPERIIPVEKRPNWLCELSSLSFLDALTLVRKTIDCNFNEEEENVFNETIELLPSSFLREPQQEQAQLLLYLLEQQSIRHGGSAEMNAQVSLLGPLEARLIARGRVIVTCMNYGNWPQINWSDMWHNRGLRQFFDLPPVERRKSLSSHDILQCFSGSELYLTRPISSGTAHQKPSVSWIKLIAMANVMDINPYIENKVMRSDDKKKPPQEWVTLYPPDISPVQSITELDRLLQQPLEYYIRNILNIKSLDDYEEDTTAIDLGVLFHRILEQHFKKSKNELNILEQSTLSPLLKKFARPMLVRLLAWVDQLTNERNGRTVLTEKWLQAQPYKDLPLVVKGRADRIDFLKNGSCKVIDYKLTRTPSIKDIYNLHATQLIWEGLILRERYNLPLEKITLEYWNLKQQSLTAVNLEELSETIESLKVRIKECFSNPHHVEWLI